MIRKVFDLLFREVDITAFDRWLVGVLSFGWLAGNGDGKLGAFLLKEVGFLGLCEDSSGSYHDVSPDHISDHLESDFNGSDFEQSKSNLSSQFDSDDNWVTSCVFDHELSVGDVTSVSLFESGINPANGLPMMTDTMDIHGNSYGSSVFD